MKDDEIIMIPFVAHESAMNRMERANKRLWVVIIILIIGIFVYFMLPTEIEETTQSVSETDNSEIHQSIGD
ncbi:MAG: hypothetical protein IJ690_07625 [Clostridia bacterium]|nr:hypothetical protein [Clostridia bacterium]MBR1654775.1 hypothetical protein [Clostridia bacterium]